MMIFLNFMISYMKVFPNNLELLKKKMAIEVGIYMSLKNDNAVTKQNKKSKFFM